VTLQDRDKRALWVLGGAVVLAAVLWISTMAKGSPQAVVGQTETIEGAEKRLTQLRSFAATAPVKQERLKELTADLAKHEKGILQAATVGQAQSQLLEVIKRVAKNANPPVDVRQSELSPPEPLGASYGVVKVTVSFECRIEQLVNMLADLAAAPEMVATDHLRISMAHPKQKTIPVHLTVAGVVPRSLVPTNRLAVPDRAGSMDGFGDPRGALLPAGYSR
jgi:hypothetical protein